MIKKFLLAVFLINSFISLEKATAQCTTCNYTPIKMTGCPTTPPKPRGLYVNEFFNFNNPFYGPPQGIDELHTILGVDANKDGIYEKEDALLSFCKLNRFTRISLYDISNILRYPSTIFGTSSYQDHLKRFITKAKTGGYGITDVGVTIWNPTTPALVASYNGISSACVSPNKMAISEVPSTGTYFKQKDLDLGAAENETNSIYTEESKISASNEVGPTEVSGAGASRIDALNSFKIDHMISEYEFWNTKTFTTLAKRDSAYNVFQKMMNYMKCIKAASEDPLYIYVYLGYLDKDSYDDKVQAQFIDNIADKIYLSNYKCNPNSLFQASIQSRINLFSASSGLTKANSEIVILLCGSNQSDAIATDPLNDGWCDFLGPFLKISGNTMACAEGMFKTAFDAYKTSNPGTWNSNLNSFQWYPYTLLKKNAVKRLADENSTSIASAELFTMYPNPANTSATFRFTLDAAYLQNANLDIVDINGKLIAHKSLTGLTDDALQIDINNFNAGIYFCRVSSFDWSSTTSKLVVIK